MESCSWHRLTIYVPNVAYFSPISHPFSIKIKDIFQTFESWKKKSKFGLPPSSQNSRHFELQAFNFLLLIPFLDFFTFCHIHLLKASLVDSYLTFQKQPNQFCNKSFSKIADITAVLVKGPAYLDGDYWSRLFLLRHFNKAGCCFSPPLLDAKSSFI